MWLNYFQLEWLTLGHTKIPLFFQTWTSVLQSVRMSEKTLLWKNQGVSSSIRAATALLSFRVFSWNLGVPISKKCYIFIFTRDYIYVPRLTYQSKHNLPILLLNKDFFGVIFLTNFRYFSKFQPFFEHECTEHVNTTLCEKGVLGQTLF